MAEKLNLRELLQEEQQPFVLNEYISDFQNQLKIHIPKRTHSLNPKPISKNSNFPLNFYKNPCFFSLNQSPVSTRSPLFSFQSPTESPKPVFFQIPSKTASNLLQSAFRIQKSSSNCISKSRKNGLFGSILKSLTHRKNHQIEAKTMREPGDLETDSAVWSVSNGEKSLVTSSSTQASDEFESQFFRSQDFDAFENPFDFDLQTSTYPCHGTPVFLSPTTSPSRHKSEDGEGSEIESLKKLQVEEVDEREEEKDQCSPVSVLDALFRDEDEDEEEYEHECSHPFVKRSNQQLLPKLRRFENITVFNPLEFEEKMLQHEQDDQENGCEFTDDFGSSNNESSNNIIQKVLESDFHDQACVPEGMKRLVCDLLDEEEAKQDHHVFGRDTLIAKRVSERFDLWKDVKLDTIDMMVEQDMKSELDEWKGKKEQVHETVLEIEVFVLGLLLKELVF